MSPKGGVPRRPPLVGSCVYFSFPLLLLFPVRVEQVILLSLTVTDSREGAHAPVLLPLLRVHSSSLRFA